MLASRHAPPIGALVALAIAIAVLVTGEDDQDAGGRSPTQPSAGNPDQAESIAATVVRVVDGDTIEVSLGDELEDVRYIGVDTPETVAPDEPVQCFGKRASAFNRRLVEGARARLVFDAERRDRYGRLLAYVHARGVFVNAELIRRGYARTLPIEPNTRRAGLFDRLERAAGSAGRGLWGACTP